MKKKPEEETDDMMTFQEVAAELKLNVPTIRKMTKRGDIPYHAISRHAYRISRSDLDEFRKKRRVIIKN